MNEPGPGRELELECGACSGEGCGECGGRGSVLLTGCPTRMVRPEAWQLLRLCDLFEDGVLPVGGGALDQTQWFLDLERLVRSESAAWLAKKRK